MGRSEWSRCCSPSVSTSPGRTEPRPKPGSRRCKARQAGARGSGRSSPMAERAAVIAAFLVGAGWGHAERRPLAGDASFRRYERLALDGKRAVLMDAPPPQEDVRPFLAVAGILHRLGLSAPAILARDERAGLLLLEDLGDGTYTRLIADGADETALYALSIHVLIHLH